jgi:hypothetical protein
MGVAITAIEVAGGVGFTGIPLAEETPGAAEVWAKGAIITEDGTAGLIGEASGANPTGIIGVATHAWPLGKTNVATKAKYIPALGSVEFEGTFTDAAGTYTMVLTDVWAAYGLNVDGDGLWYVQQDETTAANVRVVVTKALEATGTLFPRVRFRFLGIADLGTTDALVTRYVAT